MTRSRRRARRIIRPKYARPGDPAAGVRQAPPPLGVIEGGRFGVSVVIEVLMQKYLMHTPLYRQPNLFAQIGWASSRSTLCQIVAASRRALHPPPTNDDLDELLSDRWKLAHTEDVLKFREDERRRVDDRKKVRRERGRREKQPSHKLQSDKRRVNSG